MDKEETFSVALSQDGTNEDFVYMTSDAKEEAVSRMLARMFSSYDPENKLYSTVLSDDSTTSTVTQSRLSELATNAQTNIDKVIEANSIIARYMNIDDAIGMVTTTVASNINTNMRLSYKSYDGQKKKSNVLKRAKAIINDFNNQINVRAFIRSAILAGWTEGNYICVIRNDKDNWVLDNYPLGIAELAPYTENGRPIVQINMDKLRTALQRTILKDKKGKALYFADTLEEVRASFGDEILKAYQNRETYCRMPTDHTGVIRVNNFGKLYGLSPVFRALPAALAIETLRNADMSLAKTRAKTIIHQRMRKEVLSTDPQARRYELLAWNHNNLMKAFRQDTVVISTPPDVEAIEYIAPNNQEISTDKQDAYTRRVLSSLGVQFLSGTDDVSTTVANLSFTVLINQINAIGEQVERVLEDFYRVVLKTNGIDQEYVPTVRIIDAEMLDFDARKDLAVALMTTFAASRRTSLEMLGIDLDDERARREEENAENLSDVFTPYQMSYTVSDPDAEAGRPASDDPVDETKQVEDFERNNQ